MHGEPESPRVAPLPPAQADATQRVALRPMAFALHRLYTPGMTKRRAEGNKQSLVVVLKTYKLMAQAIQEQLKRRSDLLKAIDKASDQLKELQLQSTRLQGKAGKEKKVAELDAQAWHHTGMAPCIQA